MSSSSSSSSTSQPQTRGSNLARAIRIGLSFVNYSKPFDESTTSNDNNLSSLSLNIKPKCPGGGNFCSITSGSRLTSSSSPVSLSLSSPSTLSSSSSSSVGGEAASSISASGRQTRDEVGVGSRSTGSELASQLTSTLQSTVTTLPPTIQDDSSSIKSVNFVDSRLTDYYSDYDPMMGIRIAISLLGIIVLFAIFVVYKSHCNAKKAKRLLPYRGSNRSASGYRTP